MLVTSDNDVGGAVQVLVARNRPALPPLMFKAGQAINTKVAAAGACRCDTAGLAH